LILFCHWHKKAEELMKTNSDVSVTVVGGGSGVGITAMD
jgi:phosphate transport system substrate-binding protein